MFIHIYCFFSFSLRSSWFFSFQPAPSHGSLSGQLAQVPQDQGKSKPYHKKRRYERGRPAANTQMGPCRTHSLSAGRLDVGNFSWGSQSEGY